MDDAFGFTGGAGGVENVQRSFCIEFLSFTGRFLVLDPVVPINFFGCGKRLTGLLALDYHDVFDCGTALQGLIDDRFQLDDFASIVTNISGYDEFRLGIVDTAG